MGIFHIGLGKIGMFTHLVTHIRDFKKNFPDTDINDKLFLIIIVV